MYLLSRVEPGICSKTPRFYKLASVPPPPSPIFEYPVPLNISMWIIYCGLYEYIIYFVFRSSISHASLSSMMRLLDKSFSTSRLHTFEKRNGRLCRLPPPAFITWNSNCVSLLEGLYSSNPSRFESFIAVMIVSVGVCSRFSRFKRVFWPNTQRERVWRVDTRWSVQKRRFQLFLRFDGHRLLLDLRVQSNRFIRRACLASLDKYHRVGTVSRCNIKIETLHHH